MHYYKCAIIALDYAVLTYTLYHYLISNLSLFDYNAKCLISGSIRMLEVDVMTKPPTTQDWLMKQSSLAEQMSDYKQRYGYDW